MSIKRHSLYEALEQHYGKPAIEENQIEEDEEEPEKQETSQKSFHDRRIDIEAQKQACLAHSGLNRVVVSLKQRILLEKMQRQRHASANPDRRLELRRFCRQLDQLEHTLSSTYGMHKSIKIMVIRKVFDSLSKVSNLSLGDKQSLADQLKMCQDAVPRDFTRTQKCHTQCHLNSESEFEKITSGQEKYRRIKYFIEPKYQDSSQYQQSQDIIQNLKQRQLKRSVSTIVRKQTQEELQEYERQIKRGVNTMNSKMFKNRRVLYKSLDVVKERSNEQERHKTSKDASIQNCLQKLRRSQSEAGLKVLDANLPQAEAVKSFKHKKNLLVLVEYQPPLEKGKCRVYRANTENDESDYQNRKKTSRKQSKDKKSKAKSPVNNAIKKVKIVLPEIKDKLKLKSRKKQNSKAKSKKKTQRKTSKGKKKSKSPSLDV